MKVIVYACTAALALTAGCTSLLDLDKDYVLATPPGGNDGSGGSDGSASGSGGILTDEGDPNSTCGNAVVEQGEACDDGNQENGDRCSADCRCGSDEANRHAYNSSKDCYVLFETKIQFVKAKDACAALGMHLATVDSGEDLQAVLTFITGDVWLGGSDELVQGQWEWLDGENWNISPCNKQLNPACNNEINLWTPGEPSGDSGEDYLRIDFAAKAFRDTYHSLLSTPLCEL